MFRYQFRELWRVWLTAEKYDQIQHRRDYTFILEYYVGNTLKKDDFCMSYIVSNITGWVNSVADLPSFVHWYS